MAESGSKIKWTHRLYLASVFFLTLSGFGQMPIFKRYHIADIPGLGWLAEFYVTLDLHYVAAAVLIGILVYSTTDYLLLYRKTRRIAQWGYIRCGLLTGLVLTGIMLVVKNLPGVRFSPAFIVFLDLAHLHLVFALLVTGLICIIFKKDWMKPEYEVSHEN